MNDLTMGQRIAARRKLLNLSQEALAERLELRDGDRLVLQLTATTHTDRTIVTRLDDLIVTAP